MEVREIAKRLLEFFGPTGEHFTVETLARNKAGVPTVYNTPDAVTWCMVGGMRAMGLHEEELSTMCKYVRTHTRYNSIPHLNDQGKWGEVKEFLCHTAFPEPMEENETSEKKGA